MSNAVIPPTPANVIAVGAIWPPVCAIAVALRFYTRHLQEARLSLDDWLTVPALILTFGLGALLIYGVDRKSLAYPTPKPPDPKDRLTWSNFEITTTKQIVWEFELIQIPALAFVKLSFIFFYRRIFCTGNERAFSTVTYIAIAIIIAWAVSFFFVILFHCGEHFAAWWTSIAELNKYCKESLDIQNGWAISDFVTDLIVVVLPLPQIWKLHMSVSRRLAVITIFLLGTLAVAASITRMVIFIRAIENLKKEYHSTGADNLTVTTGLYWSMMESGLGLTAACLPTLYSLLKQKMKSTTFTSISRLRGNSMSSDRQIVSGATALNTTTSTALKDINRASEKAEPRIGQILVKKTLERTEEIV